MLLRPMAGPRAVGKVDHPYDIVVAFVQVAMIAPSNRASMTSPRFLNLLCQRSPSLISIQKIDK